MKTHTVLQAPCPEVPPTFDIVLPFLIFVTVRYFESMLSYLLESSAIPTLPVDAESSTV